MKKMTLLILLIFPILAQAPVYTIDEKNIIDQWNDYQEILYWQPLIEAVVWVESRGDTFAYNEKEGAVGAFQIRQCRVDHYARLTGSDYELEDFFDYDLSREMFLFFAKGKDYEKAARNWNGSGPKTNIYWNKIQKRL